MGIEFSMQHKTCLFIMVLWKLNAEKFVAKYYLLLNSPKFIDQESAHQYLVINRMDNIRTISIWWQQQDGQ